MNISICVHEFYKNPEKAIAAVDLEDELDYHKNTHGRLPKKVNIIPLWADCDSYKCDKNTMTLFAS
ncbi:MAG: hypothetical protein AB7G87_01160 [Clostridia bacterium]